MTLSRKLLFFPAVAVGVIVFILLVKTSKAPSQAPEVERAHAVRVITVPSLALTPVAQGYGNVEPGQVWEAIAEVAGKIVFMHPEMKKGSIIRKGEVLFRIDPREYGLAATRSRAGLSNVQAQLTEIDQREKNLRDSLEVEKRSLAIATKELERRRDLVGRGTISRSEFDEEEQTFLTQRNKVQDIENSLRLIPAEREAMRASLQSGRSDVASSRLDLGKTVITAPFDCRISEMNVELSQYAAAGTVLAKADSMATSEVLAQIPLTAFRSLAPATGPQSMPGELTMESMRRFLGLRAVVRLPLPDRTVEWPARFSRHSETMDPQTRTIGVYVVVDNPYLQIKPGERPPLVRNMYCQVVLYGRPRPDTVVVPRNAIHEGVVYLAGADNRLRRASVRVSLAQGNVAVVAEGVAAGDRLVLTDLVPAVDGMLLEPTPDDAALAGLRAEAMGPDAAQQAQAEAAQPTPEVAANATRQDAENAPAASGDKAVQP